MHNTNTLPLNKLTPNITGFLKSLGWKVVDAWTITGKNRIQVEVHPDRYSRPIIIDKRYDSEKDYMKNYWSK